jgi:hypothetical protein
VAITEAKEATVDFNIQVKLAVYHHFAETGQRPTPKEVADRVGSDPDTVLKTYKKLRALRVLVLEDDGRSIRMASPFSGVPTQHVVESDGVKYFANCGWDALGIAAALHKPATVRSRCEQSKEPLHLEVTVDGPPPSDWLFHSLVPAAQWWDDIVFT